MGSKCDTRYEIRERWYDIGAESTVKPLFTSWGKYIITL